MLTFSYSRMETELKILQKEELNGENNCKLKRKLKVDDKTNKNKKKFIDKNCDLVTDEEICLFDGQYILQPPNSQSDLVGHWTFDDELPLDSSGNQNHAIGYLLPGFGFGGNDSGALFNGNFISIPYANGFNSKDFSITFWLFLVEDFFSENSGNRYCPIMQQGKDDLFAKTYKRFPAFYLDRKEKNLKVIISTKNSIKFPEGEDLISRTRIAMQRWYNIAIIKIDNKIKLLINGILDGEIILTQDVDDRGNNDIYLGGVPWMSSQCNFPLILDNFKYYKSSLDIELIQSESSVTLGGHDSNFLQLGCIDCRLDKASLSCVEGYRLCTSIELNVGGYQIARSMGWLDWNTHIWTYGASKQPDEFKDLQGLGLCCAEI